MTGGSENAVHMAACRCVSIKKGRAEKVVLVETM